MCLRRLRVSIRVMLLLISCRCLPGEGDGCRAAPLACQPYACSALRLKKGPGVSDRDISGFMDGGSYMSQGPGATPPCVAVGGQDMVAIFVLRERGRLPVIGKVSNRLTPWLPGKPAEEHAPHCSL